ncbi:unnamed protein product [Ectocarpus sp. 8 AP-2014]
MAARSRPNHSLRPAVLPPTVLLLPASSMVLPLSSLLSSSSAGDVPAVVMVGTRASARAAAYSLYVDDKPLIGSETASTAASTLALGPKLNVCAAPEGGVPVDISSSRTLLALAAALASFTMAASTSLDLVSTS